MTNMARIAWVVAFVLAALAPEVVGAEEVVLARLNGEPVYAAEVDRELRLAKANPAGESEADAKLRRAALDQVIDRRLVMKYLAQVGEAASSKDVDLALSQFEKELKAQNLTLEQHCQQVGFTKEDLRRSLAWKVSWKRYCDKQLSATNLEKYFVRYRRDFDGTQLRVAQIFFKLPAEASADAIAETKERASELRSEIVAGKLSFAEAAKKSSESPSRESGGDIGWIERQRPMPEDFSKTAFALKKGEISEPLVTSFGVHLVTVLEEKPGMRTWQDVEGELRPAVTLYLFRWIADKGRESGRVEYVPAAN
jgi:peptidyl-prolyl cis-trans isomerase C